jgi:hypothetical protein
MHYNHLIIGKNKKIATIFYGLFAFDREKGEKHPYPNPNRYPNFFSSFD